MSVNQSLEMAREVDPDLFSRGLPSFDDTDGSGAISESRMLGLPRELWAKILAPASMGVLILALWEMIVRLAHIPEFLLPAPSAILHALIQNWSELSGSLWITLSISLAALCLAVVFGLALGVLFAQSRWIELSMFPYAVVLQVTPVVAIAPLIIIWANNVIVSLLICAWLVAFFPILSNTTLGLNSADRDLVNLFRLYGATRWQTLRHLRLPSALPYFLAGVRISGGLSLIGAVVAEFVAGTGGTRTGLASRILESGYQLQIPRMFAALLLVSACGVAIFVCLSIVSHYALRNWHESVNKGES